jgi:hypothetical protein
MAEAHELFNLRKDFLVDALPSSIKLKYRDEPEPDWSTWASVAEFFDAYHTALVEIDNKSSGPWANIRMTGI